MTSLRTGTFPHIAAGVRQSDHLFLSLDGKLQAQKTIDAQRVNTLTVTIGLEDDSSEAIIEDVQLFDDALFPEDIAELSAAESPLEGGQGGVLPGSAGVSPAEEESLTPLSDDGPVLLGDGDGPVVTTTITYYYLNGQRVAQAKDGVFTWIHADHLSSATRITDMNGLEVRRLAYTSFGAEAENQGSSDEPKYTYTGKEQDSTGLYYFGARYYDPALSRFITADTVYDVGPQGLNRYSYALNNPLRYIDPSGYASKEWENWEDELKQNVENRFADVHPYDLTDEKKDAITFEEVRKLQNKYRLLYYQTREYDPGLAILDPLYQQEIAEHGIKNKYVKAFIRGLRIGLGIGLQYTVQDALAQSSRQNRQEVLEISQKGMRSLPSPNTTRLTQDINVNPNAPSALPLNMPIGSSSTQQQAMMQDIADARAAGATDFRVDQQQVNAAGQRVGTNRPDLQYTRADGTRVYIEYDRPTSGTWPNSPRGRAHANRILANDPNGVVILRVIQ